MSGGEGCLFTLLWLRKQASLFAGLALVAALCVGAVAGITGLLSMSATTGVRGVLQGVPAAELALRVALPLADGDAADDQDRRARAAIGTAFRGDGGREVPVSIARATEAVGTVQTAGARRSIALAEVDDLPDVATLIDGDWAASGSEATMQADAAAALGLAVGDVVTIDEDAAVALVGTWRLTDPEATRWMGDPLWIGGTNGRALGPLVIDRSVWPELSITPQVRWTVVPDVARWTPADLTATAAAAESLGDVFVDAGLGLPSRSGRLMAAVDATRALVAALQTAAPLALLVLGTIGGLAIWQFAGLIARARQSEIALVWARGASARTLAVRAGVEAAVVVALGALVGGGVAVALLANGPDGSLPTARGAGWAGLAAVCVAAVVFAARTARSASLTAAPNARRARLERSRGAAGAGALVLVTAAAVVATWQLLSQGPVSIVRSGAAEVDLLALIAPALTLAAVVLIALAAFAPAVRLVEPAASHRPGLLGALTARTLARRGDRAAIAIVMIGLAVGQLVVAASYAATWDAASTQAQELRLGAALTLTSDAQPLTDEDLETVASVAGVGSIAPVRTETLSVGGEPATVVGVSSAALAELGTSGAGAIDPVALAEDITPASAGLLPDGASEVTVAVSGAADADVSIWVSDSLSRRWNVPLETASTDAGLASTGALPAGSAPWRLAAIDVSLTEAPAGGPQPVIITGVETDAGAMPDVVSSTALFRGGVPLGAPGTRAEVAPVADPGTLVRFLPAPPVAGVVLSRSLADRLGTSPGSLLTLEPNGAAVAIQTSVADIAAAVPGTGAASAILIDSALMDAVHLASDAQPAGARTAWIGARGDVTGVLRSVVPSSVTVDAVGEGPERAMLSAGPAALWIAAAAGSILAVAGVVMSCAAQLRERRGEVALLRALGVPSRAQYRLRLRELLVVEAWAIIAGVAAGAVVVLLAVGTLARSGVVDAAQAIPTTVHLDALAAGGALLVLALAIGAVAVGYALRVERSARRAVP